MSDASYIAKQRARDVEYNIEMAKWLAGKSKAELRELGALGLDRPLVDDQPARHVGREDDAASMAVDQPAPIGQDEEVTPQPRVELENALAVICGMFLQSKNLTVDVIALAFATGNSACTLWDGSQAKAARKFGVQRMNICKAVKKWQRLLNLPPNHFTRPPRVSKTLSESQKRGHWRNQKYKA
jgi:hypothetical protein